MAILVYSFWSCITVLLITLIICPVIYFKWAFKYWERKKIPYIKPSIPFGTLVNPFQSKISFRELITNCYAESKRKGLKHVGLFTFTTPTYMPIDVHYIKHIMSKDFHHFVDRGFYFNEKDDPLSANLSTLEGKRWKSLRMKLTPTFTSGKMKMMFRTIVDCGEQLTDAVDIYSNKHTPVDIKDLSANFTTDVISSCAFGIVCYSFKHPKSEFKRMFNRFFTKTKWETGKALFSIASPTLARMFGVLSIPKDVSQFFCEIVKDTVQYRERNNICRNDFFQILLELKEQKFLTIKEVMAQTFVFFIAGFQTTSTTIAFCLFELAQNQDVQEKLRDEIKSVLEHQKGFTYEAINQMEYMKQVINEVLRKYPPLSILIRKCVLDYKIPNTEYIIEKGTKVFIPLFGLQNDSDYFPEPERFDPDRFSPGHRKNIIPFTYMPFGEGPRQCIANKFGFMETGIALTLLIRKFRFTLSEKTKLPLKMNSNSFSLSARGSIWLNVDKV